MEEMLTNATVRLFTTHIEEGPSKPVLPHFLLQIQGSPVAGAQDGALASSTMGAHSLPGVCTSPLDNEPAQASGAHQRCGARAGGKPVAVAWARRVAAGCVLFACAGASSLVSAAAGLPQPAARSLPRPPLAAHTGRPCWAGLERIKTLRLRGGQDKLTRTASVYQEEDDADAEVGNSDGDSDVSIELTSILGFGSFSTVYAGETRTGESLAVKRVQLQNADDVARRRLKREIRILSAMDHPNIVQLHRVIEDADCVSLVQEQCTGGELFDFVNDFQTFHANG